MPKAAFADSTTAPSDHHSYSTALDDLEDVHMMMTTLVTSACLIIEDGNVTKEYAAGLSELSRASFQRLQQARTTFHQFRPKPETAIASGDPWIEVKLFWRVIDVIKSVRREAGLPVYDAEPDWPEALYVEVTNLARGYVQQIADKVEDWDDALEVGSYLPWIESVIRQELSPSAKSEPLTAMEGLSILKGRLHPSRDMRDQFIAQAHAEGFSTADISMALGLRQMTVERTIRKLTQQAAPKNADMPKSAALSIRIPDDLKKSLEKAAEDDGRSVASYVLRALEGYLTAEHDEARAV